MTRLPRRVIVCLWLCCVLAALGLAPLSLEGAFSVSGRQLLNGGAAFQVRGVCYHPRPIGMETAALPTMGDFFGPAFSALHERDLPRLRAMGANVVRVYGWAPGVDHKAFLDACYNGGVDPIHVIVNLWIWEQTDWSDTVAVDALCTQFAALEDGLAGHPAVLALALGNEVNQVTPPGRPAANGATVAYWRAMERVAAAVKARNPARLVTVPTNDALAHVAVAEAHVPGVDFWSLQLYRGDGFGTFFTDYAALSAKPVVLTEFGMDAFDHAAGAEYPNNGYRAAQALGSLWQGIAAARAVCAGGCVFEYSDEWGKVGGAGTSASTHDAGGFAHPGFPDGWMDEEWWGLFSVAKAGGAPDVLQPRAAVAVLTSLWQAEAAAQGRGDDPRLINVSTRARVGGDEELFVAGFIVRGTAPRLLLVRAVGPQLSAFGLRTALADPRLDIDSLTPEGNTTVIRRVASNDNWEEVANPDQLRAVTATHTGFGFKAGRRTPPTSGFSPPAATPSRCQA
jgi:hypothetical protein